MNIEEIKVGETYNVRVRVALIEPNRVVCRPLNQDGTPSEFCPNYFNFAEAEAFYPADGIKSAKNAQKYDPNRKFRKGDRVKPAERNGRKTPKLNYKTEYTVTSDEDDYGTVGAEYFNGAMTVSVNIPFYWLELVTPVEELGPYMVGTDFVDDEPVWNIYKDGDLIVGYTSSHPNAKAAAEAERDRLNAEWRKEQNNG